jgi:hypothetical protein
VWLLCNVHFLQITQKKPANRQEHLCVVQTKARSIAAVKNIDASMLKLMWQELEYRIDVCRVTRGENIEYQ